MNAPPSRSFRRLGFGIAAGVVALDQATKIAADRLLAGEGPHVVIPDLFNLWYSRNRGGLFGYFRDLPDPWRGLLLTLLPAAAVVAIAIVLARSRDDDRVSLTGLSLILGGAMGNLIDRVARGEVVDFLDFYVGPSRLAELLIDWFGTAHWPTFNIADSAIVVGASCLAWRILRPVPLVERAFVAPAAPREPV